jgi:predicted nicotinamide N-methyase
MTVSTRTLVQRHTRVTPVPGLEALRLHLSDDVLGLWHAVQVDTRDPDAALPYWAFAWAGGLAIARYIDEHPEAVASRTVFDVASGSGLCAIAALRAGATQATANDVDPFAAAAIGLNARANGVRVSILAHDVLDEPVPDADVILAGDCCYERGVAARIMPWLERARDRGITILVGDPGRRYLPTGTLSELAEYEVRTTTDLEDMELTRAWVYTFPASERA